MEFLSAFLFALAVSLDGFGVGFSYGVRQIKIPFLSLVIICLSSAFAITVSMACGGLISRFFNPAAGERTGALIILGVGIYFILQAVYSWRQKEEKRPAERKHLFTLNLSRLGIVIEVLRQPVTADFDESGTINSWEALVLGFALAMDALGAGFGAAIAGFKVWLTPLLVAGCKLGMISAGMYLGENVSMLKLGRLVHLLPGLILILIGLINF